LLVFSDLAKLKLLKMSNEEIPPPDPAFEDEEEEIIKVEDESPADLVAPMQQQRQFIQKAGRSGAAENVVIAPQLENPRAFELLFSQLLAKEMSLKIEQLSSGEYLALVLMHLIQNSPVEGRFAVLRALEHGHQQAPFYTMTGISSALCEENVPMAIRSLHEITVDPSFEPYLTELKNRLLARRLKEILRAYSVITTQHFFTSIGYARQGYEEKIQDLLARLQWTVDQDGFIHPTETEGFRELVGSAQNADFGPERSSMIIREEGEKKEHFSADALQRLVTFSEFLDRPL